MAIKRLYATTIVIPLLLTATALCGQQEEAAADNSSDVSSKSITALQQELAKSRAELESRKRDNLKLAEQRKVLEAEATRLREQLSKQEQSTVAGPQNSEPVVEQEQAVPQQQ